MEFVPTGGWLQAVHMAEKALTDSEASEGDVICAPRLLEVILQNCRGRVDQCVPHFISLALARLAPAPLQATISPTCPQLRLHVCTAHCRQAPQAASVSRRWSPAQLHPSFRSGCTWRCCVHRGEAFSVDWTQRA